MLWNPGLHHSLRMAAKKGKIKFVGGATVVNDIMSLTSLTGGIDTAAREGDVVVVATGIGYQSDVNPGIASPSGYTEVADLFVGGDSGGANLSVNWKRMTSTPDTSISFNGVENQSTVAVALVWRGVHATTPIDVTTTTSTSSSGNPNPPAITPVTDESIVIVCGMVTLNVSPRTLTAPAIAKNYRSAANGFTGYYSAVGLYSLDWFTGAGAIDPPAFTGDTGLCCSATLALRPA